MAIETLTDPLAKEPPASDEIVQLRRWGRTKELFKFPPSPSGKLEYVIGSEATDIRVSDPHVSKQHARLVHDRDGWKIYDAASKNGLYVDGLRCEWAQIRPGTEIGLGTKLIIIAESVRTMALRGFLQRVLGWEDEHAPTVDLALRSILATTPAPAYALVSKSDPVAIAYSLHRLLLGTRHPFITCDPKREITSETVRSTENYKDGKEALPRAVGGTLCVVASRLPRDFDEVWSALLEPSATTRLAVCSTEPIKGKKFLPPPILVPPLAGRTADLKRIIYEYTVDALVELGGNTLPPPNSEDLDFVREHDAGTLAKIETATLRFAALRALPNVNQVAARLGMTRNALVGWIERRGLAIETDDAGD